MTATAPNLDLVSLAAAGSSPTGIGVDDLRELMRSVNQVTEQLQTTHQALQQQVGQLQKELSEANAQLSRSRSLAALGEMAAGIAHEIRNPLASIQLFAGVLRDDLREQPGPTELCQKICRGVELMDAIVRDMLLFAREARLSIADVAPSAVIQRALEGCSALLDGAAVDVTIEVDDELSALSCDAGLLAQALANVVRNAVEAMSEHRSDMPRRLRVSATRQMRRGPDGRRRARVVLAVTDNGPGIPAEVQARMFNPFFTTRQTGTGLGLAIVHRVIDAHGGHVNVVNGEGKPRYGGATVELCLPESQAVVERSGRGISDSITISRDAQSLRAASRTRARKADQTA